MKCTNYWQKLNQLCCVLLIVCLMCIPLNNGFAAGHDISSSLQKSIQYLHRVQNDDGGFAIAPGKPSNDGSTAWVLMALGSMGENGGQVSWQKNGHSPLDYLASQQANWSVTTDIARTALAVALNGGDAHHFAGRDLIGELKAHQMPNGQFAKEGEEDLINAHVWTVLALSSAGETIPNKAQAKTWLCAQQNEDGGFSFAIGLDSDVDDTAAAVQALVALQADDALIQKALRYLKTTQQDDGGFAWQAAVGNAASDGWTLQALYAAGEAPDSDQWKMGNKSVIDHLFLLQNEDGSFNWQQDMLSNPVMMTAQAAIGLSGRPFTQMTAKLFADVFESHWAYESISELVRQNVISGYPDGTFAPAKPVARAEFAKLLIYSLGQADQVKEKIEVFADLPLRHWANPIIRTAVDQSYLQGYPGGLFKPANNISGAEVMVILVRALGKEEAAKSLSGASWYEGYVRIARESQLIYPNFDPLTPATRAECAYALRQLQLK